MTTQDVRKNRTTETTNGVANPDERVVMRYLFFTYIAQNNEKVAHGNVWGKWGRFPSNAEIKGIAEQRNPGLDAVVTGWKEFDNEDDWNAFTGA